MKRILHISLALFLILAAPALAQDGQDHGHDHSTTPDGHGDAHAHDAETPSVAVTQWTESMELFMEHPVLLTGHSARFIIHLTILDGFQPVREGSVSLLFRGPTGASHRVFASELLRDGIFTPSVSLPRAGAYEFELSYSGPGATSTFHIQDFVVYADADAIPGETAAETADEIAFLKEQQWKIPFATSPATEREIKSAGWAIGEVLPSPTAYAEIVAPVDGVIQAGDAGDLALPGSYVTRGEVVARIAPPLQGDGWASSQLALAQAERNFERAERLREKDAISTREYEEAQNEYLARKAGHQRLAGSGNDGILSLTAPINGQVIDWQVRPGQRLQAGDKLMAIADPSAVWLKVNVYENDYRRLGTPVGAYVHSGGEVEGWAIPESDMRVLTTGGALDPVTRTIPVLIEVTNTAGRLTIHETTPVELYASEGAMATAVPRSAVYEDEGLDVVFVQSSGESFAKRVVEVGPRHAGWVSILAGIQPGERVVTRGGYHVKLASTSAEIGHGHAH
ncbi:MAG: efflux RND transporter periplasmic adaptor subunit [Candidatus Krumholzibacteriota bacterium]